MRLPPAQREFLTRPVYAVRRCGPITGNQGIMVDGVRVCMHVLYILSLSLAGDRAAGCPASLAVSRGTEAVLELPCDRPPGFL